MRINVLLIAVIGVLCVFSYIQTNRIEGMKERLKEALTEAQLNTAQLQSEIDKLRVKQTEDKAKHDKEVSTLLERIKRSRVYIKPAIKDVPSTPGTDNSKDATKLSREVAAELVDIARTGDEAIIQLNHCIDQYNAVRNKLN